MYLKTVHIWGVQGNVSYTCTLYAHIYTMSNQHKYVIDSNFSIPLKPKHPQISFSWFLHSKISTALAGSAVTLLCNET